MKAPQLNICDLHVSYDGHNVLNGVSLTLRPGENLAIVGESGCGKSTLLRAVMGLLPRSARTEGSILCCGKELCGLPEREYNSVRGRVAGMVFQDPEASFCPVVPIRRQALEVLYSVRGHRGRDGENEVLSLFSRLGLEDGARIMASYPYELSGGMKQRISLALSVLGNPPFLLLDEVTSALDVVNQQRVLEICWELREKFRTGLLMTTHQLPLLKKVGGRMAVLKDGVFVEEGPVEQIFAAPQHPYTRLLLSSLSPGKRGETT